jgi:hypothetical protein
MRWTGKVAQMGRSGMHIGYWWESQKNRDHYADQDVSRWIILKWILEITVVVACAGFIWLRTGTSRRLF